MLCCRAAAGESIPRGKRQGFLQSVVDHYVRPRSPTRILLLPPDQTRLASHAGEITSWFYQRLAQSVQIDVMPALGTHQRMSAEQFRMMFGDVVPYKQMLVHDWRRDTVQVGQFTAEEMAQLSAGRFCRPMKVEVNSRLVDDSYDLIVSIGQVVPHEVIGFANYSKNVCVGAGGMDVIHKSHFLSAVCNIETVMGHRENPVRQLLDQALLRYVAPRCSVLFVLTVVDEKHGEPKLRGLFAGPDRDSFEAAADLSALTNVTRLPEPVGRCVVFLDPREFRSTWLGNKAIYRTRMAMADGGDLWILAPAVATFGEDRQIDALIRQYGYRGTPQTIRAVGADLALAQNLAAAAHLIHGSSEGRFKITYCPGAGLTCADVEGVGYHYQPLEQMLPQLPDHPERLREGWHRFKQGAEFYYIRSPALGLWTSRAL